MTTAVRDHLICADCGYDLYGIANNSDCPECGLPVWRSRDVGFDLDIVWQRQIERALQLRVIASAGWSVCLVVAIAAWAWAPLGIAMLPAATMTAMFELRASSALWTVPTGRRPLIRSKSITAARVMTILSIAALAELAVAGVAMDGTAGWVGWTAVVVACVMLAASSPREWIVATQGVRILQHLGSHRLGWILQAVATARVVAHLALCGALLLGFVLSPSNGSQWPGGLIFFAWLMVAVFAFTQLLAIGYGYDLWRTVRHYRRATEAA